MSKAGGKGKKNSMVNRTAPLTIIQPTAESSTPTVTLSPTATSTPTACSETQLNSYLATSAPFEVNQVKYDRAVSLQEGSCQEDSCRTPTLAGEVFGNVSTEKRKTRSVSSSSRRQKSLYGVSPHCDFGPKGYLNSSSGCILTIPDPSNQRLHWIKPPLSVLIIRKHLDASVLIPFKDLVVWLVEEKNMLVYVECTVMKDSTLAQSPEFHKIHDRLRPFNGGDDLTNKVDLIICLGGDGTLLYASSLFQTSVPPVMAFNMGSLGFLTPFHFYEDFKLEVTRVLLGSASLLLRYRLKCVVLKQEDDGVSDSIPHVKNIHKEHSSLKMHKMVLNEVVVDRGPSSYLSNLDLYIEGRRVTSVQGDGLIISTPTGSTAYAVAAGASMIHPSVPCILLTPICPHSLSFRPIVVPAGVEIKVTLSPDARGTAMVSFDGRDRQEMNQGDSLRITTASYPVPSICATDQIEDWFDGLAVCLNWNVRRQQRPLLVSSSHTSLDSFDSDNLAFQHNGLNAETGPWEQNPQQQQQ